MRICFVCHTERERNPHGYYRTCKVCAAKRRVTIAEYRRLRKEKRARLARESRAKAAADKIAILRAKQIPKKEPKRYVPKPKAASPVIPEAERKARRRAEYVRRTAEFKAQGLNSKGRTPGGGWLTGLSGLVMRRDRE